MDIAIIGPEKFQFQDMACIELALGYRTSGPFRLIPEPTGGEDASLQWSNGAPLTLEVQIKGAEGITDLRRLAHYLLHYPPRKSEGCLLERLMEDDERHALFITTARCTDDLMPLLLHRPLASRPSTRSVPYDMARMLKAEVDRLSTLPPSNDSRLKASRLANTATIAGRAVTDFERALARVGLLEQETAETIEVRLHSMLRAERFDTLSIRGMLARFSDTLATSKRTQSDALQPILQEIAARSPDALRPDNYHDRGIEDELEAHLRNDSVLLLVGPPRVGKSWTAKAIGDRLQQQGYEIRRGAYVDEAERFLTDSIGAERTYILDDPLGSREPLNDASARFAALSALCQRIPSNRRLIVAQSEQVLLQVKAAQNVDACAISSIPWRRLNPLPVNIAIAIWRSFAETQSIALADMDRIAALISADSRLRDPGAIVYLAQTWSELGENPAVEEILLQARRDASDFARSLAERLPGTRDVLVASALATTPSDGAGRAEIAFIVNGAQEYPSLKPAGEAFTILGAGPMRPPPTYMGEQCLSSAQQSGLDALQRRRFIMEIGGQFNFTHPYLRAGAQALVAPDIPSDLERVVDQLKRAICSASPITSLAVARNLRWLRSTLRQGEDRPIFAIARLGVRSVFPATRDSCFDFLIESADLLPENIQNELPHLAESMVLEIERISVQQGIGFLSDAYDWAVKVSPIKEVMPFLDAIDRKLPLSLDLSLSKRLLQTLEQHPDAMKHAAVHRLLHADEAVVRSSAAKIWLAYERQDDEEILRRIENDTTPSMSVALLEALQFNWVELSAPRRDRIIAMLSSHLRLPTCASVLFSRLVLLNRRSPSDSPTPWRIFTALMPAAIESLPLGVSFADGRLSAIVDEALEMVPGLELFPVLERWAKRLFQRADHYLLSEYEIAIVEPLIEVSDASQRVAIINELVHARSTGIRVVVMRALVENWNKLSSDEQMLVRAALSERREDAVWIRAVALTVHAPEDELVGFVGGDVKMLDRSTTDIELGLGEVFFSACVHMYVGWPQPLWWYGAHHSRNATWKRVIRDLAGSAGHALQEVAFYELASFDEDELAKVIDTLPESSIPLAFNWLLNFKVAHVGDWRTEAWLTLLMRAEHLQMLDECLRRIDEVIEGILEDLEDIEAWLGTSDIAKRVRRLLPGDYQAIWHADNLLKTRRAALGVQAEMEEMPKSIIDQVFFELCQKGLDSIDIQPPRIAGTWKILHHLFREAGASPDTLLALEDRQATARNRYEAVRDRFSGAPEEFSLPGWVEQLTAVDGHVAD